MNSFIAWFFAAPRDRPSVWRTILWWEARRIPFNIIIGAYGFVCLVIFFAAIFSSGVLEPGEDAVEPIAVIFAPFGINLLYTLGWAVEIPARWLRPDLSPRVGPFLLKAGLGLGLFLITLPAAFWVAYRIVQVLRSLF